MPFLAPFAPLIGSAVGMLASRGKSANAIDPNAIKPFTDIQERVGEKGTHFGIKNVKAATKAFKLPMNFWKRILSGDRTALMEMLGPEVRNIHAQSDTLRNTMAQFAPRGGGLTSTLADLGAREAGQVGSLIQSVRPRAAGELAELGSRMGGFGTGLMSTGASAASAGAGALTDTQRALLAQQSMNTNRSDEQWGGFGTVLGKVLADLFGRKGGGGGGGGGSGGSTGAGWGGGI